MGATDSVRETTLQGDVVTGASDALLSHFGNQSALEPQAELVELIASGRLGGDGASRRALDLGRGHGANAVYLALSSFGVTCVDFSEMTLRQARVACAGVAVPPTFVRADLLDMAHIEGPFDLVVGHGIFDGMRSAHRSDVAATITRLTRVGGNFLLWSFYGSIDVPSRASGPHAPAAPGGLREGEERILFGDAFEIERLRCPEPGERGMACLLMTRA
jgi:SAM-dependent methyltransferase